MLFKLDENMPNALAGDLGSLGHDGATCEDEGLRGATDADISRHCNAEFRILITFDLDFADIRTYQPGTHPGIVVLRLKEQDIASCEVALGQLFRRLSEDEFRGNLIIVEDTRI